jgi:uncharacterized protein YbdZ (MbtH family)
MQVQLVRIQLRVPEYGWTTQKVFHLLNALVCALRCGSFAFRPQMDALHPDVLRLVLYDLPGGWTTPADPAAVLSPSHCAATEQAPLVALPSSWRLVWFAQQQRQACWQWCQHQGQRGNLSLQQAP